MVRRTAIAWNKAAAAEVPGWPNMLFAIADRRNRYTVPIEQFSETFQADVARFLNRVGSRDLFRRDSPKRSFAAATLRHRRDQIRRVASALVLNGVPIAEVKSLKDIVAPDALSEALTFFWRRSGETMTGNIYGIAVAMLSIARHHVQLGDSEIARIRPLVDDCNPRQSGLTPKNTERLRQFLDERNVAILLGLPERLVTEARQLKPVDEGAALMVQTAVAIELLMMTMVRRKNLVSLDEEVHVKWSRSGRRGICHIAIDAAEVKNREPLQFELPERSAKLLRLYMQEFQPVLRTTLSRKLFPGRDSTTHKNAAGLGTVRNSVCGP